MQIIINEIPPSENKFRGRENVWDYRSEKSRWMSMIFWTCKIERHKRIEGRAKVTITYYFKGNARRDPDNYPGKFIMDGLVKAKVIRDDSFQCIDLVIRGVMGNEREWTVVEVEEIA